MDVRPRRSFSGAIVFFLALPICWGGDAALPSPSASVPHASVASLPPVVSVPFAESMRETAEQENRSAVAWVSYRTRVPAEPEQEIEPEKVAEQTRVGTDVTGTSDGEAGETPESSLTLLGEPWHQVGPITAEYLYTGEVFNNAHGGMSTQHATRYRGNFDLTLRLDTEAANWWTGGELFVYMQQSHGTTLTPRFVGDGQYYSNIDTGTKPQDLTLLGEYWYQHTCWDDQLSVRLGRQDPNTDFAFGDLGGDFINSSFVTLANIPMPYWPFQTLGVSALYQPAEQLRLGGGLYDQGRDEQQWWVVTTSRGMFGIAQADFLPFADHEDALLTIMRGGVWYTSSDTQSTDASRVYDGNYGLYATIDRMLWPEAEDVEQGLGAFVQYSWAPPDRNMVDEHFCAGVVYRGLIPNRDADTVGFGFTRIAFSSDLRDISGQTSEDAVELFYKVRVRPWMAIEPDLQYIARPYGLQRDALVAGIRFEAAF